VVALLLACAALLPAACGGRTTTTTPLATASLRSAANASIEVPAGKPIVLGLSVPLTGVDAPRGVENRDAVLAALNRWKAAHGATLKGHPIALRVEDDGCTDAAVAAEAAGRLLRQAGLVGVVGPECSAGVQTALPVYAQAGIVALSGAATRTDLTTTQPGGGFFFRTAYSNAAEGANAATFVSDTLQAKRVYLVDDSEAYGADLASAFAQTLQARGTMVLRASVQRGAVDFSQVAHAAAATHPDFVGFAGFNPEAALFYRQLRDAGYQGPFGAGDGAASLAAFVAPLGRQAAEGVYLMGCSPPLSTQFLADFRRVHGSEPNASTFTAQFADAARILLDAVERVAVAHGGTLQIDPAQLRDAIRATHLVDGVSGHVAFDAQGDRTTTAADVTGQARDLGLTGCQVHNGAFVILFPP
jgi:branched-chain amino acid transport system substrate-binding protein